MLQTLIVNVYGTRQGLTIDRAWPGLLQCTGQAYAFPGGLAAKLSAEGWEVVGTVANTNTTEVSNAEGTLTTTVEERYTSVLYQRPTPADPPAPGEELPLEPPAPAPPDEAPDEGTPPPPPEG